MNQRTQQNTIFDLHQLWLHLTCQKESGRKAGLMKTTVMFGALIAGLGAFVPVAAANTYFQASGSAFHGSLDEQQCLSYTAGYVTIPSGQSSPCNVSSIDIYASVGHAAQPNPQTVQDVYLDGACSGTFSCTLYSYDYDGTFLGSDTVTTTTGTFQSTFALTAAQQTDSSYETLSCAFPVSSFATCVLYGFEVDQH